MATYGELQEENAKLRRELQEITVARDEERREREELQKALNLLIEQQAYESWLTERRLLQVSFKTCRDQALVTH